MHEIDSWAEEMRAAYLYRVVAEAEAGTPRENLFNALAGEAEEGKGLRGRRRNLRNVRLSRICNVVFLPRQPPFTPRGISVILPQYLKLCRFRH